VGEELHAADAEHVEVGNDHIKSLVSYSFEVLHHLLAIAQRKGGGPRIRREARKLKGRGPEHVYNTGDDPMKPRRDCLQSQEVQVVLYCSTQGPVFSMKRHPYCRRGAPFKSE
jgi:hypothetical protein